MSPSVLNSSVPRRRLGRELRQLRERLTQLPQTSVASELEWSATKLWRMERGEVPVRSGDVVLLCELYGVDEETTEILAALATKTREKGWWHDYASLPSWFELYVGLEEAASRIRVYQSQLIPGVLQTREYATAVFTKDVDGVPRHQIADRVAVRLGRARLLTEMMEKSTSRRGLTQPLTGLGSSTGSVDLGREVLAHAPDVAL